jgi:peptide/nickel transport system permease protein
MSVLAAPAAPAGEPGVTGASERTGYWRGAARRFREDRIGLAATGVLIIFSVLTICAPLVGDVTHQTPDGQDLTDLFAAPSWKHLLGTDQLGRDTLMRLLYGGRVSLGVAFLTVTFALVIGVSVGVCAAYGGGAADDILMRLVDSVLAIPALLLLMLMAIIFQPGPLTLAIIIASVSWCATARLVRAEVLSLKTGDHILAARSLGSSNRRIVWHHILPHVVPTLIVVATLSVGQVILIEAALDFLGIGIQPPTPSWGNMLTAAQGYLFQSVWVVLFPGAIILLTVGCMNLLGNALRDALDPRARRR